MSSQSRSGNKRRFLELLDHITGLMVVVGSVPFGAAAMYFLYAVTAGSLSRGANLGGVDDRELAKNLHALILIVKYSGLALAFGAAIRYYQREVTGYILLVVGGVVYFLMPRAIASSAFIAKDVAVALLLAQKAYTMVGTWAMLLSAPLIIHDIWLNVQRAGVQQRYAALMDTTAKSTESIPIYARCWQMPFCRDYLKRYCPSYRQRRDCWRVKSGCFCDEEAILRAVKDKEHPEPARFDAKLKTQATPRTKHVSEEGKKERCRGCQIYQLHQKQKYRILSPLVFPVAFLIMWAVLSPVMALLDKVVSFSDRIAEMVSVLPGGNESVLKQYGLLGESATVQWIFVVCFGLILAAYLLHALEYLIYELEM